MRPNRQPPFFFLLLFLLGFGFIPSSIPAQTIAWSQALSQPDAFYATTEALRITENIFAYQHDDGGWPKNVDFAAHLSDSQRMDIVKRQSEISESTIDNGATVEPMRFMARVYWATGKRAKRQCFYQGLEFLLKSQYPNGGWPQFPNRKSGYHLHITYNDNAMINVLGLLRDITDKNKPVDYYEFIKSEDLDRCTVAINRGIDCILKTQIRVDGKLTAWCAQYDEQTLKPAEARAYEKISLSGSESVGIIRFLMGIENPSPEIRESVEGAVAWLESVKITGIRVEQRPNPEMNLARDRIVMADPNAPPLWARFYEIGTNKPIFCGRDGVVKYSLAEIEPERRNGYSWYGAYAASLLAKDYPNWRKRIAARD